MEQPKIGILTFQQYHGKVDIGSSRIRAEDVARNSNGTMELFRMGQPYDVVVYQKVYFPAYAKLYKGIQILDICDADWLYWNTPLVEHLQYMDAVVCSTEEIAKFMVNLTDKPVVVIPDRIDFQNLPEPKIHTDTQPKLVWYGYDSNFDAIDKVIHVFEKRGFTDLIVVSNKPYVPPRTQKITIQNYAWSKHTFMTDIQRGDIVINPKLLHGHWKYKSDNKTTLAWALGMPVALHEDDLDKFKTADARNAEATKRLALVKEKYDIVQSVADYQQLITELHATRIQEKGMDQAGTK